MKASKQQLKRLGKRGLSLLMAMTMCLSLIQISAFATADPNVVTQTNKQISGSWDGDTVSYTGAGTVTTGSDWAVQLSRTLEATGTENLFNVNMQVVTKDGELEVTNSSAAVTLVLDTSGSMARCAECGESNSHATTCSHYSYSNNQVTSDQSRLAAAKTALVSFLNSYAKDDDGNFYSSPRMVSLVTFAAWATPWDLSSASGNQYWVNVNNQAALDYVINNVINKSSGRGQITAGGGTNTDDGMSTASYLLNTDVFSSAIGSIDNRFCVLLTDGKPTYYNYGYYIYGNGNDTTVNETYYAQLSCSDVTDTEAALYSIAYGLSGDTVPVYGVGNVPIITKDAGGVVTGGWLKDQCGSTAVYDASSSQALINAFRDILTDANQSTTTTNGVTASIGQLLGESAHAYTFIGFNDDGSGLVLNDGTPATSYNGASVTADSLEWNLSTASSVRDEGAKTTMYSLSYQVRLNNNVTGFLDWDASSHADNAEYSVGSASLTYQYTALDDSVTTPEVAFPDVKAHGYLGHFDFMKIAHHQDASGNDIPLAAAPFQLTNLANAPLFVQAGAMTQNTTSQTDAENETLGQVEFTGIPSGYSYTLSETGEFTYEGRTYQPSGTPWTVSVSYGEVSGAPSGDVENTLKQIPENLTLTKTWQIPATASTQEIQVDLKQDGTTVATLALNGSSVSTSDNTYQVAYDSVHSTATKWVYILTVPSIDQDSGGLYAYTTEEHSLGDGYTTTYSNDTMSITNTTTGTTSVYVEKHWLQIDGQDMTSKPAVNVTLTANGSATSNTFTMSDANGWSHTFADLPAYDSFGQPITYSVSEASGDYQQVGSVTGTGTAGDPFVLTNTVLAGSIDVPVSKTWNDGGNSNRPDITVELLRDGQSFGVDGHTTSALTSANADASVAAGNVWTYTFTGLPEFGFTTDNGVITAVHKYQYSVKELSGVDGYTSIKDGNLNLINTRSQDVSIEVSKEWNDDFASHDEVTIQLLQNGDPFATQTSDNGVATFSNLPQFDTSGDAYAYTVIESDVPSRYTPSYNYGTNDNSAVVFDAEHVGHVTVTNTLQTNDEKISVDVYKVWQQPTGTDIPIATFTLAQLNADNQVVNATYASKATTDTDPTHVTFDNLPKYYDEQVQVQDGTDETGAPVYKTEVREFEYQYSVTEDAITGYNNGQPAIGVQNETNPNQWTFTNTITGTVTLDVEKQWQGLAGTTFPTANIQLMRTDGTVDGNGQLVYEAVSGKVFATNTNQSTSWTVDKYSPTGKLYTYKVVEATVNNYSTSYSPANATYTQDINKVTVTNTLTQDATFNFTATKTWLDNSNDQGTRKPITLTLYQAANGLETAMGTVVISANGTLVTGEGAGTYTGSVSVDNTTTANQWSIQFSNLNKYAYVDGTVYAYSYKVTEAPVDGYSTSIVNSTITNTLTQSTSSITMSKYWVDPDDTAHPDATFTLDANVSGTPVTSVTDANGQTVTFPQNVTLGFTDDATVPSADQAGTTEATPTGDIWYYTWSSLPKYDDNQRLITYTVSEGTVNGYTTQPGEGYSFTNTIVQEKLDFDGQKVWDMKTNQTEGDYLNPSAQDVTIGLYYVDTSGNLGQLVTMDGLTNPVTVTPVTGEDGSITGTFGFKDLPRYDLSDGSELHYTVREIQVTMDKETGEPGYFPIPDNGTLSLSVSDHGNDFDYNYTVSYHVDDKTPAEGEHNGTDTTVTNTYQDPNVYFYRILGNYYTIRAGQTTSDTNVNLTPGGAAYIALTPAQRDALTNYAVTADPDSYTSHGGVDFDFDSGNQANELSVTLSVVNHMYTIQLNYVRHLYTLTVNYVFPDGDKPTTGFADITNAGSYLGNDTYSGTLKTAPTGFQITKVTMKNSDADASNIDDLTYNGGSFDNHDVIVTYYYNRVINPVTNVTDPSFTIQKIDAETENLITHDSADFQVYTDAECTAPVSGKVFSTSSGEKTVNASDLGAGTWYLKESKAPTGYTASDTVWKAVVTRSTSQDLEGGEYVNKIVWTVDVTENGEEASALTGEGNDLLIVPNTRQYGYLTITKAVSGLEQNESNTFQFTVSGTNYGRSFSKVCSITVPGNDTKSLTEAVQVPTGTYVVTEDSTSAQLSGYTVVTTNGSATVTAENTANSPANATVTNEYTYVSIPDHSKTITGTKVWDDDSNRDGLRPASIRLQLYRGDTALSGKTADVSSTGNGAYAITYNSYLYPGSITVEEIGYTDSQGTYHEGTVPGYEFSNGTDDNDYTVTNYHSPETVMIEASKVWNSGTQQPVTFRLNANGQAVGDAVMTLDGVVDEEYAPRLAALINSEAYPSEFTEWTGRFPGTFYKYADGKLIDYSVTEDSLGSNWSYTTDESALTMEGIDLGYAFTVTNSYSSGGGGDSSYYYRTDYVYTGYGADGSQIYSDTVTGNVQTTGTSSYSFTAADTANHGGYAFSLAGDADLSANLTGTSRSDPYVFTVYYEFTDLTEEGTPTGETPDNGTTPDQPTDDIDIPEDAVPKADVPATGDILALWIMAAAVSGLGLVWLSLSGKKRHEDENS